MLHQVTIGFHVESIQLKAKDSRHLFYPLDLVHVSGFVDHQRRLARGFHGALTLLEVQSLLVQAFDLRPALALPRLVDVLKTYDSDQGGGERVAYLLLLGLPPIALVISLDLPDTTHEVL